jgi:hypothetical protein
MRDAIIGPGTAHEEFSAVDFSGAIVTNSFATGTLY